jgi:hypothetical protein
VDIKRFRYTENYTSDSEETKIGLIAQEVAEYCPEAVREDQQGVLSLNVHWLQMHGLNALKSLIDENKRIRKELSELREMTKLVLLKYEL